MSYVELPSRSAGTTLVLARDARPGAQAEGEEESLLREEIPIGYREQIKKYFDQGVKP